MTDSSGKTGYRFFQSESIRGELSAGQTQIEYYQIPPELVEPGNTEGLIAQVVAYQPVISEKSGLGNTSVGFVANCRPDKQFGIFDLLDEGRYYVVPLERIIGMFSLGEYQRLQESGAIVDKSKYPIVIRDTCLYPTSRQILYFDRFDSRTWSVYCKIAGYDPDDFVFATEPFRVNWQYYRPYMRRDSIDLSPGQEVVRALARQIVGFD